MHPYFLESPYSCEFQWIMNLHKTCFAFTQLQFIFKPMILEIEWNDFSEIFTQCYEMLVTSFKTQIVLHQAMWTYILITFRNCYLFVVFSRLKISLKKALLKMPQI